MASRRKPKPLGSLARFASRRLHRAATGSLSLRDRCAFLTIRSKEGQLIPFRWNSAQEAYWRARPEKGKVLVLKYRQGGFTTLEMADSYERMKRTPDSQQVFLADQLSKGHKIFDIARRFWRLDADPPEMGKPPSMSEMKTRLNSWLHVGTAGARAFGRGFTFDKAHGSEGARWPGDRDRIDDIVLGLCEAAKFGLVVMETTANGMDPWFYPTWQEPRDWRRVFIPWFHDNANRMREFGGKLAEQVIETLQPEEEALVERHGLDAEQIAWRRAQRFALGHLFLQEYPEEPETAFLMSGETLFDLQALVRARRRMEEPARVETGPKGERVETFRPEGPRSGLQYFVGADVAEGVEGGDRSAWSVRDAWGGLAEIGQCADEPMEFAYRLAEIGKRWANAEIVPEANSIGRATVDALHNVIGYAPIYRHTVWDGRRMVRSGRIGWLTTGASKPVALANYKEDFENGTWDVPSGMLLDDMRRIVRKGGTWETNGRDVFMADAIVKEAIRQRALDLPGPAAETVDILGYNRASREAAWPGPEGNGHV